ncbi:MAG: nicotinamide-nucleotide amidase [Gammaproteobacteria bacterium]|nr:nicotinamide-nucleotide amidase [Sideroxydans sp.]MBU3902798.1 nicotinamide-nucleotide amidase [Gammaproteobacteria bacterium]MBU4045383.1 nicotinamide-nucleotide amidase [Gammaproteobacteria bacterium]MBU4150073.1 nicotinamide-nucleotide amidase [Gammaproteobacteria bacterium]
MHDLSTQVGAALKSHGMMLATAESCTGGGIAQAVTSVSGSSAWFERGFVTYSNLSKQQMLGVQEATLIAYGAVSEAVVREMAEGALRNSTAQVSLAVSGIAGPDGGTPDKPVGTVWFAWALADGVTTALRHRFSGDRDEVRAQAVRVALQGILERLTPNTLLA